MKKKSFFRMFMSLLLVGTLLLAGCPSPDNGGGTTTPEATTPGGTTPDGTTPGGTTGGGNPSLPTPSVYGNPNKLAGTGDTISTGAAVLTATAYTVEGATERFPTAMANMLSGAGFSGVYTIAGTEPVKLSRLTERTHAGGGAVIISDAGFVFENCTDFTLSNITLVGTVSFVNCQNMTLDGVQILAGGATAVATDAASKNLFFKSCRIEGKTAVDNNADFLYFLDGCVEFTDNGILDLSKEGLYIRNCRFVGIAGAAVKTASENAEIRKSTITLPADAIAIEIGETKNVLVAENCILDAQRAVVMTGADNSVVVRNTLVSVEMKNSEHAYICDNAMGGRIYVSDIDYILADGNRYPEDGFNHTTEQIGITNSNGDSLMDVSENAYLAVGANEDLLPHVDRDQFFGEERKTLVRDPDGDTEFGSYVMKHAETDDIVIVAPGAYTTKNTAKLGEKHKNTTIYAYGAFAERSSSSSTPLDSHFYLENAENVTVKGGSYGFEMQGHAQAHVIEKLSGNRIRLRAAAGFMEDVGLSNSRFFNKSLYGYRQGNPYFYLDALHTAATLQSDGTVMMTVDTKPHHDMIEVGDVITTRPNNELGAAPVYTKGSTGIVYQDMTIFASMVAVCFHEYYNESSVTYYRVADAYRSGVKITEEEYNEYKALEKQYGITTEVWYDAEHQCYRGPAFRNASLDGVHVVASKGGAQILSSSFERLGDDGTNQFAYAVRLSSYRDNGNGTMDIIIKGQLSQYNYINGTSPSNRWAHMTHKPPIVAGDPIMIYTSTGNLVMDAIALVDESEGPKLHNDPALVADGGNPYLDTIRVRVRVTDFNADALEDYLPYLDTYTDSNDEILPSHYNSYEEQYKVYFHVGGYASAGARVENTKVDCCRSRAALLRSPDSSIKNCTYRHIGGPAIGVIYEAFYAAESAVIRDMVIENNIIDHVHYNHAERKEGGAVTIDAPGELDIEKSALYRNLTVRGNTFRNRSSEYAVYVEGIAGIRIENNDFGREKDMELPNYPKAIYAKNATDLVIAGNKYAKGIAVKNTITLSNIRGLSGRDVNDGDMFPEYK